MTRSLLFVIACAAVAPTAGAQTAEPAPAAAAPAATSVSSRLLGPVTVGCQAKPALSELTNSYNSGDWSRFQTDARALLDALRGKPGRAGNRNDPYGTCKSVASGADPALGAIDYESRYVALIWVGNDAFSKTQLMRAIVHSPEPEPFSSDVPGVRSLTEVVLSSSLDARAISLYTSTRENDPLAEQAQDFIKAIFAPLSTTVAGLLGDVKGGRAQRQFQPAAVEQEPRLAITIKSVALPFERASIKLQMRMRDLESADDFRSAVDTLGNKLLFDGAGRSDKARTQVTTLVDTLPEVASRNCKAPPSDAKRPAAAEPTVAESAPAISATGRADIRAEMDRNTASRANTCLDALDKEIKRVYEIARRNAAASDGEIIEEVDKEFRSLGADGLATTTELALTFKNRPLTHFSFGAGSAVATYASLNRVRVKIDEATKNLVSDPLSRVLTLAFVNWSPRGYNESSAAISGPERVRLFFGAALTPDFGVVGGGNLLLFRGIGVIGGYGMLFGKGAEPDEVGKPPAATADPFKTARAQVVFVGIAYTYK